MRMRVSSWFLWLAAAQVHGAVWAQPIFYDDFNGNALQPHWLLPPPWAPWLYNVSDGMLNVDRVLYPSNPKVIYNWAFIGAIFEPIASDFHTSARMGWEAGEQGAVFFELSSPQGGRVAGFGYGGNGLFAKSPTQTIQFAAPAPGLYDFAVGRTGNELRFYLDGVLLGGLTDTILDPAGSITLGFHEHNLMPSPGALHVDHVLIVPSPATGVVLVVAIGAFSARTPRIRKPPRSSDEPPFT
jgi:hypothetical protein